MYFRCYHLICLEEGQWLAGFGVLLLFLLVTYRIIKKDPQKVNNSRKILMLKKAG